MRERKCCFGAYVLALPASLCRSPLGIWGRAIEIRRRSPKAHTSNFFIFHLPGTPLMCVGLPYRIRDYACIHRVCLNWGKLRSISCPALSLQKSSFKPARPRRLLLPYPWVMKVILSLALVPSQQIHAILCTCRP